MSSAVEPTKRIIEVINTFMPSTTKKYFNILFFFFENKHNYITLHACVLFFRDDRGDSMVGMLKLLSVASYFYKNDRFDKIEFWISYSKTIKALIKSPSNEDPSVFMQKSKIVAEKVLK